MRPFSPRFYKHTAVVTVPGPSRTQGGGNPDYDGGTTTTLAAHFQFPNGVLQEQVMETRQQRIGSKIEGAVDFAVDPGIGLQQVRIVWSDRPDTGPFLSVGPAVAQDCAADGTPVNWRVVIQGMS